MEFHVWSLDIVYLIYSFKGVHPDWIKVQSKYRTTYSSQSGMHKILHPEL